MAGRGGYNTKTRQLILDYLINNRQHAVSASNILEHLEAEGASPNPTTVYRYLDKLAGEQRIMKYVALLQEDELPVMDWVWFGIYRTQKGIPGIYQRPERSVERTSLGETGKRNY